jgi:RNA polymerase sigma-B factor
MPASPPDQDPRPGDHPRAESLLAEYRASGDRRLRNRVVEDHQWLARAIARRCRVGDEPLDDLVQVACVGLLKAAERFDPSFGVEFKTYAAVTARGELRRHYRDTGWSVRVPRRLQDLRYEIRAATDVLRERLSRSPTTAELAEYLYVDVDEIIDCLCADSNFRALSIHRDDAGEPPPAERGTPERGYDEVEAAHAFRDAACRLPGRLRRIVEMRFVDELKQSDIAAELGVSQVQVSRLLRRATSRLEVLLEHDHDDDRRASAEAPGWVETGRWTRRSTTA